MAQNNKTSPQLQTMEASSSSDKVLISRLMSKVSEQALELGDLSSQLEMSRQFLVEESMAGQPRSDEDKSGNHNETLRSTLASSTSGVAMQRRLEKDHNLQMIALQRQLEATESKLAENIKTKKKLLQDLDSKSRESAFYTKKCQDLQVENQQLRHQVEQTLKMTSITAKSKGMKQHMKSVDTITHYKTCDELKQTHDSLEQAKRHLEASKEQEGQLRMRIKVLEEALEFRSEEIGLAGHSDLLAKVAKLRGEVTALKSELTNKHQKIVEIEDTSADAHSRHEALQRQVAQLQQRLSQSQQEMYRLQNGDVGEMLKTAEAERDRLLNFIQSDMQKSSVLAKQVEHLESELRNQRRNESSASEVATRFNAALESEGIKFRRLEEQYHAQMGQYKELQRVNQLLEAEKAAITTQFERKSVESDELNKMQMNLFVQNQSKDEEITKRNEEVQSLRAKLRELQASAPSMESDNTRLRERLKFLQDEVNILRDSVNVMEPKLARIEPELNMLRNERDGWLTERLEMDAELSKLRPIGRQLSDLSSELQQLNELAEKANLSASKAAGGTATYSPTKSVFDQGVSLSQRHSLWVGLPSLRTLNSTLYESIRRMAHDLHSKEMHCSELIARLHHVTTEMENNSRNSESQWLQLSRQQESAAQTIQRLSELVNTTEKELSALRSNRITVDQIRVVLASYPGNFAELKVHDLQGTHHAHGSVGGGMGSSVNVALFDTSDSFHESKHSERQHQAHPSGGSPLATRESVEAMINKISDHALPDLIGRALMHNANSVIRLASVQEQLHALQREHASLSAEHGALTRMQVDYENLVRDLEDRLEEGERKLDSQQRECYEKVDSATELAEKQNALTMTLEAKIEKLHRDRQLRSAQLTALQQREESFRVRLLSSLQEYCGRVKMTAPPDACKLVDLLHYNADILRSRTGAVLDGSNAAFFSTSQRHQSPARSTAVTGHSRSDGTGDGGKKHSKTKQSNKDGKRSPSTSPELPEKRDSSAGRGSTSDAQRNHSIRNRLSPATQRFVAESNEFSSSASGIRRLPSPVISRVQYSTAAPTDALYGADELATSRGTSRGSVRLRGDATAYVRSPVLLHASRSNTNSAGNLQDRLQESKRAWAAIRESHQL